MATDDAFNQDEVARDRAQPDALKLSDAQFVRVVSDAHADAADLAKVAAGESLNDLEDMCAALRVVAVERAINEAAAAEGEPSGFNEIDALFTALIRVATARHATTKTAGVTADGKRGEDTEVRDCA